MSGAECLWKWPDLVFCGVRIRMGNAWCGETFHAASSGITCTYTTVIISRSRNRCLAIYTSQTFDVGAQHEMYMLWSSVGEHGSDIRVHLSMVPHLLLYDRRCSCMFILLSLDLCIFGRPVASERSGLRRWIVSRDSEHPLCRTGEIPQPRSPTHKVLRSSCGKRSASEHPFF